MNEYCSEKGIIYSRYADDLTFSKQAGLLSHLPKIVSEKLNSLYKKSIRINSEKTTFVSKAHSRKVTGLILTNQNNVSIGRTKKRNISAMVHQYKIGKIIDKRNRETNRSRKLCSIY